MFNFTQRYLEKNWDVESGKTTGSKLILQICMKYQRARWWWVWHKEQPDVNTVWYMIKMMLINICKKHTF